MPLRKVEVQSGFLKEQFTKYKGSSLLLKTMSWKNE